LVVASAISGIIAATLPPPALAASADTSPTGMVAFFPQSECPVGWEPATYEVVPLVWTAWRHS
jgi:hypothetical protein